MRRRVLPLIGAAAMFGSLAIPQALIAQESPPTSAEPEPAAPAPAQPESAEPAPTPESVPPTAPPPDPVATAPASTEGEAAATTPVAVAAGSATVTMRDFSFSPATVSISAGDSVTWVNAGPEEPHTATGDGFDTGTLDVGESGSATFSEVGTFAYVCSIHPDLMKGTVQVLGGASSAGTEPSPSTAATGPGSEAAAVSAPNDADDDGLPASGLEVPLLVLAAAGLLTTGALLRRARAR